MLQYKTVAVPTKPAKRVFKKNYQNGIPQKFVDELTAPIDEIILSNSKEGWVLSSMSETTTKLPRKKTLGELLFGWIPILGPAIFRGMVEECVIGIDYTFNILVFVKEV